MKKKYIKPTAVTVQCNGCLLTEASVGDGSYNTDLGRVDVSRHRRIIDGDEDN